MSTPVAILLCTHNGARFLAAQLDSLEQQTHKDWRVWASDDGSDDATGAVLSRYRQRWGAQRLSCLQGPRRGPAANFMSLLRLPQIQAAYFAFCDQDDVWEPDHLRRGLAALQARREGTGDVPLLYGSRTRYIDAEGRALGLSGDFRRPPGFANALVQCMAGGNTMILNGRARDLLARTPPRLPIVMHDWWAYLLVTGCGGQMVFDDWPSVRYRQHGSNQLGMNRGLRARWQRLHGLLGGALKDWNAIHFAALADLRDALTPQARATLDHYAGVTAPQALARWRALRRSGVYRQRPIDNLALTLMALLGRL